MIVSTKLSLLRNRLQFVYPEMKFDIPSEQEYVYVPSKEETRLVDIPTIGRIIISHRALEEHYYDNFQIDVESGTFDY